MDVQSAPGAAKRMWSYLRAVFLMLRKGKRRLLLGLHLLMKRRNNKGALARSVATLLSHSHHGHGYGHAHALRHRRRGEYEFSCSGSPVDPRRRSNAYFPCLLGSEAETAPTAALQYQYRIEYDNYAASTAAAEAAPEEERDGVLMEELAAGEDECGSTSAESVPSPLVASAGGFSVRVSNFSSEDGGGGGEAVDEEAEEFISRFYEQLRQQNQIALSAAPVPAR